jgi:hypothetical protein
VVKGALLLVVLAGCRLSDTLALLPGDPIVQVEAVLDPTRGVQTVLVQRSQSGVPTTGIFGAAVTLTDLDPRGCATPAVQLVETSSGVYQTTEACPLAPGDRVALHVSTGEGAIVTGITRIPGIRAITVRAGATSALFPPAQLVMDRTRDSVRVSVDLSLTHAIQIEAVRTTTGEDATLRFVSDTPSAGIPGDLVDPFDERTIFRAGCYYELTVAALDTNYFDFTRSITNPLTGRGFINHLSGGVGVFGSIAPATYELRVTAPQTDAREGVYRFTGEVAGSAVGVTWDVYRDALSATRIRAFVDGRWAGDSVRTSANGNFTGDLFRGTMFNSPAAGRPTVRYTLVGTRAAPGTPFPVTVRSTATGSVDTVTAVQISGPGGP